MFDSTYLDNWNQRPFVRLLWKVGMFDSDLVWPKHWVKQNIIWAISLYLKMNIFRRNSFENSEQNASNDRFQDEGCNRQISKTK